MASQKPISIANAISTELNGIGLVDIDKIKGEFIDSLNFDIERQFVPDESHIKLLEKQYSLVFPYTSLDVFFKLNRVVEKEYIPKSSSEYDKYLNIPNSRQYDALKQIAMIRDRFDLVQGIRIKAMSDFDFKYEMKPEVNTSLDEVVSSKSKEIQQNSNKSILKNIVNSYFHRKGEIGKDEKALLKQSLMLIENSKEVLNHQIDFLKMSINLSHTFTEEILIHSDFLDALKTALLIKNADTIKKGIETTLQVQTISNRLSLASNIEPLLLNTLYPYKLSFGTGDFDNYYPSDMRKFKSSFYRMILFQESTSANSTLSQLSANALKSYLRTLSESSKDGYKLLALTRSRSVADDINSIMKLSSRAIKTNRSIEAEVITEIFSRQEVMFLFNSDFLTFGLDYIIPKLKEGHSAKEIVDTMVSELSIEGYNSAGRWCNFGKTELLPTKKNAINKALSKYMHFNKYAALAHSKVSKVFKGISIKPQNCVDSVKKLLALKR